MRRRSKPPGMLRPLGIDKAFKPDARQRAILEEAARIGDAMIRFYTPKAGLFDGTSKK
jgi:hypothetical protein